MMGSSVFYRFSKQVFYVTKSSLTKNNILFFATNSSPDISKISATSYVNLKNNRNGFNSIRGFSLFPKLDGSAGRAETTSTTQGLNKLQAQELILRLTSEERNILNIALNEYLSKLSKDDYEGHLASSRWRSKYGRPVKLPSLGDVDPTGSFCAVPEDWLMKKCAESVPKPATRDLVAIAVANAIPFVGFGFLDNFFMILFGDYIDLYFCSYFYLSTMAAAALGNTFSDVLGIGTAFYVERLANRIGFNPPKLTPIQMDMPTSRNFANLGRVLGVTVGCLLGMLPLLLMNKKPRVEKKEAAAVKAT